jgi:hypothetical protein
VVKPCVYCNEEIEDVGEMALGTIYDEHGESRGAHRECSLRMVLGGIGHLEDHDHWCLNYSDPDGGRTFRQSSIEVWEWVKEHGL